MPRKKKNEQEAVAGNNDVEVTESTVDNEPQTPIKKQQASPLPIMATSQPEKPKRGRKPKNYTAVESLPQKDSNEAPDEYLAESCRIIGRNIRLNRKLRKFSIDNLADYLELSASYVGLLERGERCPSLKTIMKICDLFDIALSDLFSLGMGGGAVIMEKRSDPSENKRKSIISLIQKLDDVELDFVITVLKGMKMMQKRSSVYENR